jgi:ATP-dependent DNA ligase
MISQIVATLKEHNLTNDKKRILKQHESNKTLQLLFKMTYHPRYNYWIRASDMDINPLGDDLITLELLEDILAKLNGRVVTGNAARAYLQNVINSLHPSEAGIIVRMINRDMDCKVSTSLVNDLWHGTIQEFPVMLADKFNMKTAKPFYAAEPKDTTDTSNPKLVVQLKADGGRLEYVAGDAGYSRNGSKTQTHDHFDFINAHFAGYVVDGEVIAIDPATGKVQPRKVSNGLYTKAVRGTLSKEEAAQLHYIVWDMIPADEFWAGQGTETYKVRLKKLQEKINSLPANVKSRMSLIPTKIINFVHEAQTFYGEMLGAGEEGAMLKLLDSKWCDERSKDVLKLKEEKEATLRCVGVIPHAKKPGQIGSLELATECGLLTTSCGSGLTDDDRKKDPSEYIGQLIDIKFNALIQSKHRDTWSMFLPIFKNIRYDVTGADTLAKLK